MKMKKSILTLTLSVSFLFSTTLVLSSCGSANNEDQTHGHMDGEEHNDMSNDEMMEHSSDMMVYACPMHPEITGMAGDTCSICGMDLKEVPKAE
jgi:hypothetical protein